MAQVCKIRMIKFIQIEQYELRTQSLLALQPHPRPKIDPLSIRTLQFHGTQLFLSHALQPKPTSTRGKQIPTCTGRTIRTGETCSTGRKHATEETDDNRSRNAQAKILQTTQLAIEKVQVHRNWLQQRLFFKNCTQSPHQKTPQYPSQDRSMIYIYLQLQQIMGNDGGDIPGRKELVRDKKKVEVPTAESIAMGRARFCNLTKQPLTEPLAICRLGYIYNYENLLSCLVRKELPEKYAYIRKLTDIRKVIIERASAESNNYIVCPISKLEYNGFNKFVAFWPCGHVVSRKALKEVKLEKRACVVCQQELKEEDLIDLNLQPERLQLMCKALIERRLKKKQKKEEAEQEGKPRKMVKEDVHVGVLDRLGGEFRDVIRNRQNFKGIFQKQDNTDWKNNTFVVGQDRQK